MDPLRTDTWRKCLFFGDRKRKNWWENAFFVVDFTYKIWYNHNSEISKKRKLVVTGGLRGNNHMGNKKQ